MEEVSVMLKSALAFSPRGRQVNFVAFTDSLGEEISDLLGSWNRTGRFGGNIGLEIRWGFLDTL